MENIHEMRKRHEKEIEELRMLCSHDKLSDWMGEYWAIGHSTGYMVKICRFCGKVIEKRNKVTGEL